MIKIIKEKNKRFMTTIVLVIFILGILTGCSSSEKNPSVKEVGEKIKKEVDLSNMIDGDGDKLKNLYDMDEDEIEEFVLYTASSNIKADEIAIIKVKDDDGVKDIQNKIAKRIDQQAKSFKDYLPDEYFLIENHVLETKDHYVLFVISKDAETIENVFYEAFE